MASVLAAAQPPVGQRPRATALAGHCAGSRRSRPPRSPATWCSRRTPPRVGSISVRLSTERDLGIGGRRTRIALGSLEAFGASGWRGAVMSCHELLSADVVGDVCHGVEY